MLLRTVPLFLFSLLFTASAQSDEDRIFPTSNFRTPQNIAFATIGSGSSHHMWVFEILKELNERGHNVTFYSRKDQLHFAKDYPMIKSNQIGNLNQVLASPNVIKAMMSNPSDHSILTLAALESIMMDYPAELPEVRAYFERDDIDLVVCDALFVACVDAAILANKPVAITFTYGAYSDFAAPYINNKLYDSAHPTTETESIWRRAYSSWIKYPYHRRRIANSMKEAHALQRKLGLTPTGDTSDSRYRDVLKLINNVYGIELARPSSAMVQMIGPVMPTSFPPLDDETKTFLNTRSRVCYIGFGQFALASPTHAEFILRALLTLKDEGHLDGIIWGRVVVEQLPATIRVGDKTWTRDELLHHPDILLMDWAPQFGILQHPSTAFFVSHGGVGSLHEALHSGVRPFVFPFFGDQPGNARAVERTGIGRFWDKDFEAFNENGYQRLYKKLYQVAADPTGEIQKNVDRYSAHVQINTATATPKSADLLEELMFASNDAGVLSHRRSVGDDIHWVKRYNIDLFALAAAAAVVAVSAVLFLVVHFTPYNSKNNKDTNGKVKKT